VAAAYAVQQSLIFAVEASIVVVGVGAVAALAGWLH
jgi:hypothetical protein